MEAGTKQFRKRSAILDCLRATRIHPSAEDVHRLLQQDHPDISLATVYRNLNLFKQQGMIRSLGTVDGVERFDGNTAPHVHFICTGCNRVEDLPQIPVPQHLARSLEDSGCQISSCQLTFTGLCGCCNQ